ncbi:MAG TPA: ABC transporter substrate-binding protein [Stellaceae bacterium]|nr:ABC transporter substrate-binding protein [Stellaceae bacterium]
MTHPDKRPVARPAQFTRRTILASSAALGLATLASPPIVKSLGATTVKIGFIDPFSGTYAALGDSELKGAQMAIAEINKKNGILGGQVQLVQQDDAADVGSATQKFHELVEKDDVNFVSGSVSSAVALALNQAADLKGILYMDTGGHVDTVTGQYCHWTTFKLCSDTWMLANALSKRLLQFGKRWYISTPDYAWGHFLEAGFEKILKQNGGTLLGNALMPLGSTDFTSVLIRVQQAKPDVFIVLQGGDDFVNLMKQAVQFGMTQQMKFGYGLVELEPLAALPAVARTGWGVMEWWWDQPNVPQVKPFVDAYRKLYNQVPSARSWFGYVAMHTIEMGAAKAQSLDSEKVSRAIEGMQLPAELSLGPYPVSWRAGDHQAMITEFVGEVNGSGQYPNLFEVKETIPGDKLAQSPEEKSCKLNYPS